MDIGHVEVRLYRECYPAALYAGVASIGSVKRHITEG